MNPNGHRLPAPVASLRKHRPRWNAATITALRPQVLPYIAARVLEPEQSPCQRACCGTTEASPAGSQAAGATAPPWGRVCHAPGAPNRSPARPPR